ncbi:SecDF P1 head subdomain-containing protein [Sediminitomix flava]|uniref:SecDF P1 head subdomain domain-containing protein n=1 Tax=Sediminitomix flava TaxID=379075 RepID=A0A315ZFZ5_SEDFL|nr:hypothetical protein [Sediminitomix flava]PWJ44232.1 hypothetical protein BC781_101582 [Sediminitomix flava]
MNLYNLRSLFVLISMSLTLNASAQELSDLKTLDRPNGFYATLNYEADNVINEDTFEKEPSITHTDYKRVSKKKDGLGMWAIQIVFNKQGQEKIYQLTKENINKPIAIVIDKHIVSMPKIMMPITGDKTLISGNFTEQEVDNMVKQLKTK